MVDRVIETTLLRGRVKLLQPQKGFHASLDTVFMAAAVPIKRGLKLLDVGCGVGSGGLCVLAREPSVHLSGLDVQQELVELSLQNAVLNGVSDRCRFFQGNLLDKTPLEDNSFDAVMLNPPYQERGTHTPSPHKIKAFSHGEEASGATLTDWIKFAHRKLKNAGSLTIIHRADRADDVILALIQKRWFGSLVLFPLYPHEGEDAKRIVIRARKERYAPFQLKAGMVIHKADGTYTKEAVAVLEKAAALFE